MSRKKAEAILIQIFFLAVFMLVAVWTVSKVAIISQTDTEAVYWERARFIAGEGSATMYSGSSLCSLGYSLILAPICALIKSPYAAYKAAILLNAVFICAAYLFSVAAARKLFEDESESFLSVVCFFAVFCPALALSRTYTGPESAVMLLTWISIWLIVLLWENYRRYALILLAVCLILIGFLQVTMLGMIAAAAVLMGLFVRQKKLDENSYLLFLLAVLAGIAAGNIAERGVLYAFSRDLDITTIKSSFEILFGKLGAGWTNGYLSGLFTALSGKLFAILTASLLFICPAFWYLGRTAVSSWKRKTCSPKDMLETGLIGIFAVQIIWMALSDNSGAPGTGCLSVAGLETSVAFLILIGTEELKNSKDWVKEMAGYLLLLCLCTFLTAYKFQSSGTESISTVNSGFLMLFQNRGASPVVTVYLSACMVMLAAIILMALYRGTTGKKLPDFVLKYGGGVIFFGGFMFVNLLVIREQAGSLTDINMVNIAPAASVISAAPSKSECVYVKGSGNNSYITILQSLVPDRKIRMTGSGEKDWYDFFDELNNENDNNNELIVITGVSENYLENTFKEGLDGYEVVYLTSNYALWAQSGSETYSALENSATERTEILSLSSETITSADEKNSEDEESGEADEETDIEEPDEEEPDEEETDEEEPDEEETDEEEPDEDETEEDETDEEEADESEPEVSISLTYGGDSMLTPGTYMLTVNFRTQYSKDLSGTVRVSDSDGNLRSASFSRRAFNKDGTGIFMMQFSSQDIMRNVKVSISSHLLTSDCIEQVYLVRLNSDYEVAMKDYGNLSKVTSRIKRVDKRCSENGTVTYVENCTGSSEKFSTSIVEGYLEDYEIKAVTEDELDTIDTDYMIAYTSSHDYYSLMDRYSLIYRTSTYMLFVRNDSEQYAAYIDRYGDVLSCGTRVYADAFPEGEDGSISLEAGDYNCIVSLSCYVKTIQDDPDKTAGVIYVVNGEDIITQKEIRYSDLSVSERAEIMIPLSLKSSAANLNFALEFNSGLRVAASLEAVEFVSQNYQYGKEEPQLKELADTVNSLSGTENEACVSVVQTDANIKSGTVGYSYLEGLLPDCAVEEISYSTAAALNEDAILLTYGLSVNNLNLLDDYSIVGHAGKYTLMAKNDGKYLQDLVNAGLSVLSSGKKVSPLSIAAMSGAEETENVIASLPKAQYNIYLELTVPDAPSDDTVEVSLLTDKTESEIRQEIEDLTDEGFTDKEALEMIDLQKVCGSATYQGYRFRDSEKMLVSIKTSGSSELSNLTTEGYTWQKNTVEAKILWVEVV